MGKQASDREEQASELEELDELKDIYSVEDKLFNITVSQISESFQVNLKRNF